MKCFRNRKIFIFLPLLLLILTAFCQASVSLADTTTTQAKKEDRFEVSAEVSSRTDDYFVVDITLTNKGKAFSGYARLNITEYSQTPYSEQVFFAISDNDTKTVQILIPFPPDFNTANSTFTIQILDEKERFVEEHSLKNKKGILAGASATAGILSDRPYELTYLDGAVYSTNTGQDCVVETEELITSMITDSEYMKDYNYIVIDDYDTSKLDKETIEALKKWTSDGGVLIFGTGAHPETLSGFDTDFTGVSVLKDASGSTTYEGFYQYYMQDESMEFANLIATQDSNSSAGDIFTKDYNYGGIVVVPFALGDKGFDHSYAGDLLFASMRPQSSYASSIDVSEYTVMEVSSMLQGKGKLSFWAIGTLILLYIVLVGPLLYLILKAMNKREYIWFVIPGVSLCFVIILFFIGRGFGTNRKQFYNISIAKADGSGMQSDYITCFDSGNSNWSARLSDNLKGVIEMDPTYSYNADKPDMVVSRDTKGLEIKMDPDSAFDLFKMKGLSENTCTGDIDVDVSYVGANFKGTVTNNTPYDFVKLFIQYGSTDIELDNVKSGQTVTLTGSEPVITLSTYDIENMYKKTRKKTDKEAYAALYLLENYYYTNYGSNQSYAYVAGIVKDYDKLVESRCDEKSYGVIYRDLQEDYYALP